MPPKKSRSSAPAATKKEGEIKEQKFVALLLADVFTDNFEPFFSTIPFSLFPVACIPLIDHGIEWLVINGVEEVIVLSSQLAELVDAYVTSKHYDVPVRVIRTQAECYGDCLRQFHQINCVQNIVRTDFLIATVGTLCNFRGLHDVWQRHIVRREEDPSSTLTLVLMECPPVSRPAVLHKKNKGSLADFDPQRTSYISETLESPEMFEHATKLALSNLAPPRVSVVLHGDCLVAYTHWVSPAAEPSEDNTGEIEIDLNLLLKMGDLRIRSDLIDPCVWIAAPEELLGLYAANFDFRSASDGLVECLTSTLAPQRVHIEVMPRVSCALAFSSWMRFRGGVHAVRAGWTYPIGPVTGTTKRGGDPSKNQFVGNDVVISMQSDLGEEVVVADRASIGYRSSIAHSDIGEGCAVGDYCHVERCVIWDGCHIGDKVTLVDCVVGPGVRIAEGCDLNGVIIGPGVLISPHFVLRGPVSIVLTPRPEDPSFARILVSPTSATHDNKGSPSSAFNFVSAAIHCPRALPVGLSLLSIPCRGDDFPCTAGALDDRSDGISEVASLISDVQDQEIVSEHSGFMVSPTSEGISVSGLAEGGSGLMDGEMQPRQSCESVASGDDQRSLRRIATNVGAVDADEERLDQFCKELQDTFRRTLEMGMNDSAVENAIVEINGLKFGYRADFIDISRTMLMELVMHSMRHADDSGVVNTPIWCSAYRSSLNDLAETWSALFDHFLLSDQAQVEAIVSLFTDPQFRELSVPLIGFTLMTIYNEFNISKESLLTLQKRMADDALTEKLKTFWAWLEESSSDDDDDDDDDD